MEHTIYLWRRCQQFVPMLCLLAVLPSCTNDDGVDATEAAGKPLQFVISMEGYNGTGSTRGAPLSSLDESVGMSAYSYSAADVWNGSQRPEYFYNDEVINLGTRWITSTSYTPPAVGSKMRIFAYYPWVDHESEGYAESPLQLSLATDQGNPFFTYIVPDSVPLQKDLLAGWTDEFTIGDDNEAAVSLTVRHLLAGVQFVTGTVTEQGTVTGIALRGVWGKGTYTFDTDPAEGNGWLLQRYDNEVDYHDYSQKLSFVMNGTTGTVINDDEATFLMLPQVLPEDARLEVTYVCGGSTHTLRHSLYGLEWKQGHIARYTINIESLQRLTITETISNWGEGFTMVDGRSTSHAVIDNTAVMNDWDDKDGDDNPLETPLAN